jgi:predicted aldo/keto reductase-like oxidoreductase
MNTDIKNSIDSRRKFMKLFGGGALAGGAGLFISCSGEENKRKTAFIKDMKFGEMTYRISPKSGDKVSLLAFGAMRLPWMINENSPEKEEIIDQEEVNGLFDYALEHGVNYFDTSPVYCRGFSEEATGKALSRHPRDKYFLATKMSNFASPSREDSLAMYHESFKALKTDYIDYYLIHAVGEYEAYKERYLDNGILDFLIAEKKAGRIRNLGWSFHGEKDFFDYMMFESGVEWDFVMIQLNYFDWETTQGVTNVNAKYLYEVLEKKKVPALIMEPLLGGRLANPNYKAQEIMKRINPEESCASWAFRFAGSLPNVLTILSGMMYKEHIQDNLKTFSPLKPLNDSEKKALSQVVSTMLEFKSIICTGCNYCMPCPYGIDIPAIFHHYNKCLEEGNFPDNPQSENYKKARHAFLVGLDRSVPKLRQANHCIGCGKCVPHCPQKIRIPKEMQKIDEFVEKLKTQA